MSLVFSLTGYGPHLKLLKHLTASPWTYTNDSRYPQLRLGTSALAGISWVNLYSLSCWIFWRFCNFFHMNPLRNDQVMLSPSLKPNHSKLQLWCDKHPILGSMDQFWHIWNAVRLILATVAFKLGESITWSFLNGFIWKKLQNIQKIQHYKLYRFTHEIPVSALVPSLILQRHYNIVSLKVTVR